MHKDPKSNAQLTSSYSKIYEGLTNLRETFHQSGRLDDSNAKLDEVAKLFATYLAFKNKQISSFPASTSRNLVTELQESFQDAAYLPQYVNVNEISIFGEHPKLALRPEDTRLALELTEITKSAIDLAFSLKTEEQPFDVINEAFGHFVRDNFRSNIEDAQYMTPPEVVNFMVDMIFEDLKLDLRGKKNQEVVMLDPSCGVGSFLAATYHKALKSDWLNTKSLSLYGQDKVERMVRLSTINLELFSVRKHRISIGNSLEVGSPIDDLNGKVDLIVTNPPFGARFSNYEIKTQFGSNTPFFSGLRKSALNVNSELLFIDRYFRLLKEGGYLAAVVPDSVISSKGTAALLRQYLGHSAEIKAIVELPAVTFAQAGTRTKTAILYLQKCESPKTNNVFLAVSKDLGFQVSSKKGVQVKTLVGNNDLQLIIKNHKKNSKTPSTQRITVLSAQPSCTAVQSSILVQSTWTPNHYSADRLTIISDAQENRNFELVKLGAVAELVSDTRRSIKWSRGDAFISVLHILGEGFVDFGGVLEYAPKSPGTPVKAGEVLVSKINPRIPRICVTPETGRQTLCSTEFEVLIPRNGLDPHELAFLMQTSLVQKQIVSLTSGTSASHNRIRGSELAEVLIPIPRKNSTHYKDIRESIDRYKSALIALSENADLLAHIRLREKQILGY